MALSKENLEVRKELRQFIYDAEVLGHITQFPVKVVFFESSRMDGDWANCELKGKGHNRYFQIAFDKKFMSTPTGRDFCISMMPHELAHALTWSSSKKVESARTLKYGDHSPEFGIIYAQLWTDLIESSWDEEEEDNEEDNS